MTAPRLVPRLWLDQESFVTDADAALLEAVIAVADALHAETANISGDYLHWSCQVCGAEWIDPSLSGIGHPANECQWIAYQAARGKVGKP